MKIGIYDPYLDAPGGGEKYMLTTAACLAKEHDVSVFWDNPSDLDAIGKKFVLDLSSIRSVQNIFSSYVNIFKRLRDSSSYDIIIFLSDGSIPIVASSKLIIHFQFPVVWVNGKSLFNQLKIRRASSIICNSQFTKSYIDKIFSINSKVVYPPVDFENPLKVKKENNIIHVGRFAANKIEGTDYKKQQVMINAFKQMLDKKILSSWNFVLCVSVLERDKDIFEKMRDTTKGYPIKFIINSSRETLLNEYAKAKIYWHASGFGEDLLKYPEKAEHFGISIVEAMIAGCVPVVIGAGGIKEIVRDGENGFLWENLSDLKGKTHTLIENAGLLDRLSKNAQQIQGKYSRQNFCKNLSTIIND